MVNEPSLSLLPICARACSCGCGLRGFQGQSTVHDSCQDRTVVGARAPALRRVAEKGSLCLYLVLYFSRLGGFQEESSGDWSDSKSSVE